MSHFIWKMKPVIILKKILDNRKSSKIFYITTAAD